jgi:hypothetical protein
MGEATPAGAEAYKKALGSVYCVELRALLNPSKKRGGSPSYIPKRTGKQRKKKDFNKTELRSKKIHFLLLISDVNRHITPPKK